jgi:hypothetical protein
MLSVICSQTKYISTVPLSLKRPLAISRLSHLSSIPMIEYGGLVYVIVYIFARAVERSAASNKASIEVILRQQPQPTAELKPRVSLIVKIVSRSSIDLH